MLRGEATNTNFIVFDLTPIELEPTNYHTRGEHVDHYATDALFNQLKVRRVIYVLVLFDVIVIKPLNPKCKTKHNRYEIA